MKIKEIIISNDMLNNLGNVYFSVIKGGFFIKINIQFYQIVKNEVVC